MLTVPEVLERLKEAGITDSIQTVRRWIRTGELKGEMPEGEIRKGKKRSEGYHVRHEDLQAFIQKKKEENWLYPEVKRLEKEVEQLKQDIAKLKKKNNSKDETVSTEETEKDEEDAQPTPIQSANQDRSFELNLIFRQIARLAEEDHSQNDEVQALLAKYDLTYTEFEQYLKIENVWKELYQSTFDLSAQFRDLKDEVFFKLLDIISQKKKAHHHWAEDQKVYKK